MNHISKLLDERYAPAFVLVLTGLALIIRTAGLFYWMDIGGDGPTKAMYAYNWYKSPHLKTHGVWLPGFLYLTGSFTYIVRSPLISIRIFNLILGTLTIPIFYLLVKKVYNHISAIFSICVLTLLPLHVCLSVNSLNDVSFLFEMIAGITLIIYATETTRRQNLYLAASLGCVCLALMTRYEAWLFIPFFPVYVFWKTRKLSTAILVIAILSIFPAAWMIGNYQHYGDFLIGFSAAQEDIWTKQVDFFSALRIIGKKSILQLEWVIAILASWGILTECVRLLKKQLDAKRTLCVGMAIFFWGVIFRFAIVRGLSFQDRYLLFGLVMLLPFAAMPLLVYLASEKKVLLGVIGFVLLSLVLPKVLVYYPVSDVSRKRPVEIKKVVSWLRKSPYCSSTILMTKMRDQSTFLPLYFPEVGAHHPGVKGNERTYFIFSRRMFVNASRVKAFFIEERPSVLITSDSDYELQQEIEKALGRKIALGNPVYREGHIKVYDIGSFAEEYQG